MVDRVDKERADMIVVQAYCKDANGANLRLDGACRHVIVLFSFTFLLSFLSLPFTASRSANNLSSCDTGHSD